MLNDISVLDKKIDMDGIISKKSKEIGMFVSKNRLNYETKENANEATKELAEEKAKEILKDLEKK